MSFAVAGMHLPADLPRMARRRGDGPLKILDSIRAKYCRIQISDPISAPMSPTTKESSSVPTDVEIHGSVTFGGEMTFAGKLTGGGIKGPVLTVSPGATIT